MSHQALIAVIDDHLANSRQRHTILAADVARLIDRAGDSPMLDPLRIVTVGRDTLSRNEARDLLLDLRRFLSDGNGTTP